MFFWICLVIWAIGDIFNGLTKKQSCTHNNSENILAIIFCFHTGKQLKTMLKYLISQTSEQIIIINVKSPFCLFVYQFCNNFAH